MSAEHSLLRDLRQHSIRLDYSTCFRSVLQFTFQHRVPSSDQFHAGLEE